ncbi:MAG: hypothetical protein V4574_14005 [Pseudomonadota bacterium]
MQSNRHARSTKRSQLLASAGAALVLMLAATSAQAQSAGANATGIRTLANQQISQNGITRADADDAAIASVVTGPLDGASEEIAGNAVETAARGNQALQSLDADLPDGESYGPTGLTAGTRGVFASGASVIANRQIAGGSEVASDIFETALRLDTGQVSSSTLAVSRNAMEAEARGNDAAADIALTGNASSSGTGIASFQSTGPGGGIAARARASTLLGVGPVAGSSLANSYNLDRATAYGNSADNRISAAMTAIVVPSVNGAASTVPTGSVGDPSVSATFGLLSNQLAGGIVKALSGDLNGDAVFGTVIAGDTQGSVIASDGNMLAATAYPNSSANIINLDAVSIGGTAREPGRAPGAVANLTNVQRAEGTTLNAYTFGGTAVDARGRLSESTVSASGNSVRTVATANLASGNLLSVRAGSIETNGGSSLGERTGIALVDSEGAAVTSSDFGVQNVQDFARSPVTVTQEYSTTAVSVGGAVDHSTIRAEGNEALAAGTGNSAVNLAELAATSMRTSAAVSNLQTGNGNVRVTVGAIDAHSGASIDATGGVSDARLLVIGNITTGTAIGSSASNGLTVSGTGVAANPNGAIAGATGQSYGAIGAFALASEQKLGEPTGGDALIPRIASSVLGETGITIASAAEDSSLVVADNAQRANALGNISVNRLALSTAALDGTTSSLSSFQYGQAYVDASSSAKVNVPGSLDASTAALTGNTSVALAAINDTDNDLLVDAGRADGVGSGNAIVRSAPLGPPSANADHLLANQQFAAGGVGAAANLSLGNSDPGGGMTGSRLTVSGNEARAEASANRARSAVSVGAMSQGSPRVGLVNTQISTAQASAAARTDGEFALAAPDGVVASGSSIAIEDNSVSALARGNVADNEVTVAAAGSLAAAPRAQTIVRSFDASVLAPAALLNTQSNYGAVGATANGTSYGVPLNGPGAVERSSIGIAGNSLMASAYGNVASNRVNISGPGQAPTAIANAQANYGNVTAMVTGAGYAGTSGPMSGSAFSITGNSLSATAVGNQATSAIASPR